MKTFFHLFLFLACSMFTYAQQDSLSFPDVGNKDSLVRPLTGIPFYRRFSKTIELEAGGRQTRYNTVLSPLLQQGPNFGVYVDCISFFSGRKFLYTNELRFSPMTTIFGGGGGFMSFSDKISYSYLYDFKPVEQFRLYTGGGLCGDVSLDVSSANTNNTYGLGVGLSLVQAVVRPEYVLYAKRRDITFRDNFSISLVRLSALPCYGDAYQFDIKLEAFNYVDFTNRFTIQVPMRNSTLSFSHVLEREKVNRDLVECRRFVSSFAIGFNVLVSKSSGRPMEYDYSNGKRIRKRS